MVRFVGHSSIETGWIVCHRFDNSSITWCVYKRIGQTYWTTSKAEPRGGCSWRMAFWACHIGLSPRNIKNFHWEGGGGVLTYSFQPQWCWTVSCLPASAKLIRSYRSQAKVFSCSSLLTSMYIYLAGELCLLHWTWLWSATVSTGIYWQDSRVLHSWN